MERGGDRAEAGGQRSADRGQRTDERGESREERGQEESNKRNMNRNTDKEIPWPGQLVKSINKF